MTAILKEEPPELTPRVRNCRRRSIGSCGIAGKAPAQRFQTAHDLVFALEALTGSNTCQWWLPPQSSPPHHNAAFTSARVAWTVTAIAAAAPSLR